MTTNNTTPSPYKIKADAVAISYSLGIMMFHTELREGAFALYKTLINDIFETDLINGFHEEAEMHGLTNAEVKAQFKIVEDKLLEIKNERNEK